MKKSLIFLSILFLQIQVFPQKTVKNLLPSHAEALIKFRSTHPDHNFLSELSMDSERLADMKKNKILNPYYLVGDFNQDKIQDFALILGRKGRPKFDNPEEAEARAEDQNLSVVVFNGIGRNKYKAALVEKVEAPLFCFLGLSTGKKPRLYFALWGSDSDSFVLTPVGKSYIPEATDFDT